MITVRALLSNISKGQSAVSARRIIESLERLYLSIREKINIVNSGVFNDGKIIHLKIPSEDKAISYDVVVWLEDKNKLTLDTDIRVYSNSPNFAYNFAYIFYKEDSLLFPKLYSHEFTTMKPKVRNPYGLYGFDKHTYSALKYLWKRNLGSITEEYDGSKVPLASFKDKQRELNNLRR